MILSSKGFRTWPSSQRRLLSSGLGTWVRSLHDRGYRDRDLYSRNILVHRGKGIYTFSKIDSPAGDGGKAAPGRGRPFLKDLADLNKDVAGFVNHQDRLRFLLAYLSSFRVNSEARTYIAHVMQVMRK